MKKWLLWLTLCLVVALLVWFSCNPFTQKEITSLNVLDDSQGTRLTITCTIEVIGSTWDGGGVEIVAEGMGDGSQAESQDPIFAISNGTVRNVTINPPACDGLHFIGGSGTISNVYVPDIGEDVCTVKKPGTYTVNMTAHEAADKWGQINDLCTITFTSCVGNNMGKFIRQNGGKTWKCVIYIDGATLSGVDEAVVRSDSTTTTVYWRNIICNLPQSEWWYGNFVVSTY